MAKIDRIKEEIGWLKLIFGALVAIDASLIGWLAQNYREARGFLVVAALGATVTVTLGVALINGVVYRRLRRAG